MTTHILACAYKGFGCSNGHISAGAVLLTLVIVAVVGGIAAAIKSKGEK